mgnify:CR=1|jgi:hypothetical protein
MIRSFLFVLIVSIEVYFSATFPALAYIDPGSGSFLLQIIGAAIVGILFYFRTFREWLQSFFSKKSRPNSESENE